MGTLRIGREDMKNKESLNLLRSFLDGKTALSLLKSILNGLNSSIDNIHAQLLISALSQDTVCRCTQKIDIQLLVHLFRKLFASIQCLLDGAHSLRSEACHVDLCLNLERA